MKRISTEPREGVRDGGSVAVVQSSPAAVRSRSADRGASKLDPEDYLGSTLTGHFAVFDQWTEIDSAYEGRFLERVRPGAFAKTFDSHNAGQHRIVSLFNHGRDVVGMQVLGPVQTVREDKRGAYYEVPLFATSYNRDLLPGLEGDSQYGASFRFRVTMEEVDSRPGRSAHNPDGIEERSILAADVSEFGPVTFPAYATASAGIATESPPRSAALAPVRSIGRGDQLATLRERHIANGREFRLLQKRRRPWLIEAPVTVPEEVSVRMGSECSERAVVVGPVARQDIRDAAIQHDWTAEDGGLVFARTSAGGPVWLTVSRSGVLSRRTTASHKRPASYTADSFHDRDVQARMHERGLDRRGDWHLHIPPDDGTPSEVDLQHWSYWRRELGLREYIGVIGAVDERREINIAAWVVTELYSGADLCRPVRVLT